MADLFGIDIAGLVAQNIGPGVLPCTLTVVTAGTRDPANPTGGVRPTETPVQGRGLQDEYLERDIDGATVQVGDRKITLIANTFPGHPVPKKGDRITIEGATHTVLRVSRDPAAATYTCQCRG